MRGAWFGPFCCRDHSCWCRSHPNCTRWPLAGSKAGSTLRLLAASGMRGFVAVIAASTKTLPLAPVSTATLLPEPSRILTSPRSLWMSICAFTASSPAEEFDSVLRRDRWHGILSCEARLTSAVFQNSAINPLFDIDHNLSFCRSIFDRGMCRIDIRQVETARIEARPQLAALDEFGGLAQDFAMMGAAFAGQERQQCEHARIGATAE